MAHGMRCRSASGDLPGAILLSEAVAGYAIEAVWCEILGWDVVGLLLPVGEGGFHFGQDAGVVGVVGQVVQGVGIFLQVEEFVLGDGDGEAVELVGGEFVVFVEFLHGAIGGAVDGISGRGGVEVGECVVDVGESFGADAAFVGLVVVPVVFGEGVLAGCCRGILEDGGEALALESVQRFEAGQFEEGGGDVDGADYAVGDGAGFDAFGPADDEGGADAVVADRGLAAREGAAVVGHEEDDGVIGHALGFQQSHDATYVEIESSDLVVVHGQIAADVGHVWEVGRYEGVVTGVWLVDGVLLVGAVGIGGGEPEEEGFLFGPVLDGGQPMAVAGRVAAFLDDVELVLDVGSEVPFAEGGREVARIFEGFGEECLVAGERQVEFAGSGCMGVASGEDAAAAGAAGAAGEEGAVESHSFGGEAIDIGCLYGFVAIGATVIPGHIVGDDDDEVGAVVGGAVSHKCCQEDSEEEGMGFHVCLRIYRSVIQSWVTLAECRPGRWFGNGRTRQERPTVEIFTIRGPSRNR